jgi:hypothetical protein
MPKLHDLALPMVENKTLNLKDIRLQLMLLVSISSSVEETARA